MTTPDAAHEARERIAFEAWAAKEWPNSLPPHSAWTGWWGKVAAMQAQEARIAELAPPAPAPTAAPAVTDEMVKAFVEAFDFPDTPIVPDENGDFDLAPLLEQLAPTVIRAVLKAAALANTGVPVREGDLEWLDAATRNEHPHVPYLREDGRWAYPVMISGAGGFGGGVGEKAFDTLLDAIKSARSEPPR